MPRTILSTTAPGTLDEWGFTGAPTSWEAVAQSSDDSSYVSSSVGGNQSDFFCGNGAQPVPGRIMAVTLHYRMRQTTAGAGSTEVRIVQAGTPHVVDTVVLAGTGWTTGEVRIREDWTSATRFTGADVSALGVGLRTVVSPPSGELQVSQLWLAVEYWDSHWFYDPYDGVTPDAVTGPRNFTTAGTQPASITGSNYLRIDDTSIADFRLYFIAQLKPNPYRQDYVTEWEIRCTLSNLDAGSPAALAMLGTNVDGLADLIPTAVRFGGVLQLGLHCAPLGSVLDPAAYPALAPLDFDGRDLHLRVKVDRDDNPSTYGKVQVFVNYEETPLLDAFFYDFPAGVHPDSVVAAFGTPATGPNVCRMDVDYVGWKSYKKRGETFRSWKGWDFSSNLITADVGDPDIVKPILINPPGIQAGQSEYACVLDVQDPAALCEVMNDSVIPDVSPTTYKVDVIYKMDIAATEGELVLQRSSDLWYWDEGGSVWSSSFQSVTLSNQLSRTQVAAMTGVNVSGADEQFLVTVQRKTAAGPAYKIFVYKVHLVEE